MEIKSKFAKVIEFFQRQQGVVPGDPGYFGAFCHVLVKAASANEASIWQLDREGRLHLVYGTNVTQEEILDVTLRVGEGISGATALSRQAIAVTNAWIHPQHDPRVDKRIDFRTHSMISAPIIFGGFLYGVVNILNHVSSETFPTECKEWLSAAGTLFAAALAAKGCLTRYETFLEKERIKKKKGSESSKDKTAIVGVSQAILEVLYLCLKAGHTSMPVLVRGETGTGKELAAKRIHEASDRKDGPFLDMNCAALAETLLESELFGHVKGAFSGASQNRKGKFSAASGGTIFLDEIGDMSLSCQAKILRVLQEKKIAPVGSEQKIDCDARIIAATNQDLWENVKKGEFREDLYYRLCGIEILIPPLRERSEDIPLLAMHFLNMAYAEQRSKIPLYRPQRIVNKAMEKLITFSWPGNVRQLEQAIFAAVAICEGDEIRLNDFPAWLHSALKTESAIFDRQGKQIPLTAEPPTLSETCEHSNKEHDLYMNALDSTKYPGTGRWNLSAAARKLDIPRKTFIYRLKRLGTIK